MDYIIRNIAFWILDFLRGRKVRKEYNSIKKIMSNNIGNKKALDNILKYAKNNTKLYKDIDESKLSNFPVVNKSFLQKKYDNIIIGSKFEKNIHWTCTSGSTGEPLKIPQNIEKRNRTKADLIYFNKLAGWKLGYKYIFIRSWVSLYKMSKFRIFAQNFIKIDTNAFNQESKEKLRNLLKKDKKIKCIISYSSAMTDFVNYLEYCGDKSDMFNIKVIVTASDELTNEAKRKIKNMFNCKIVNRISNEEHGIMAMQFDNQNYFTLNTASYYFEILKLDSDDSAKIGEIGRLVVTDLYNKKFPLIRYDIGDLAIALEKDVNGSISKLESFQGRNSDIIKSDNGILLTSVTISTHICTIKNIKKYQLLCSSNEIIVKVVSENCSIEKELIKKLQLLLGKKRKIKVEFVKDIEKEKNGKFKVIKKIEEEGKK